MIYNRAGYWYMLLTIFIANKHMAILWSNSYNIVKCVRLGITIKIMHPSVCGPGAQDG